MKTRIARLTARLQKGADQVARALAGPEEGDGDHVLYPGPPTWTVRDTVAHLLSAEDGLRHVGQAISSGGPGAPLGLHHDDLNAAEQARLGGIPVSDLLRDLAASREATIAWVETLSDADLDRTGRHPALGEITVEAHIQAMYGHGLLHLRDLRHSLQAEQE